MKASEFTTEAVRQRLDPKCWKGKHKEGTKIKGGVRVNNCVPNESVTEGHSDQQRKVFKKNGHPVGEVGIDRESSPGNGQYYMKHYASGRDLAGYDSFEEAVAELKHCIKQGVSEGPDDDTSRLEVMRSEYAKAHKILNKFGNANMGRIEVMRLLLDNGISQKTANIFASKRPIKEQGVAEDTEPEGATVKNSLHTIIRVATHLEKQMGDSENFPEWESEMIGSVKDQMVKIMDYEISKKEQQGVAEGSLEEKWTQKYKSSINCSHPKGFSQKAHCAGKKKK